MPYIIIEKDEDYLASYLRYKKTVWYKRIKPRQWLLIIFVAFVLGIFASFAGPYVLSYFTSFTLLGF